jgi:hypothetical protein
MRPSLASAAGSPPPTTAPRRRLREALEAYEGRGFIQAAPTRIEAREALLAAWRQGGQERPGESQLMLAYTREDVRRPAVLPP